jgi:hypothetical protein
VVTFSTAAFDLSTFMLLLAQLLPVEVPSSDLSRRDRRLTLLSSKPYHEHLRAVRSAGSAREFWNRALADYHPALALVPEFRPGQTAVPEQYREMRATLARELDLAVRRAAQQVGVTLNTMMQGAWAKFVAGWSGQHDILLGTTVLGRPAELDQADRMAGRFINTLPSRICTSRSQELRVFLADLQNEQAALLEHQDSTLDEIRAALGLPSDLPLYDTNFVFENSTMSFAGWRSMGLRVTPIFLGPPETPLKLEVSPFLDGKFQIMLAYLPDWVSDSSAQALLHGYLDELGHMVDAMVSA